MKKHFNFKSVYRAALVALCLLTVGVGNTWGGTKRIYCEYSGVSSWWSTIYVYAWGGGHEAKKYTMTATGTSNLVYCDIDDYHTDLLFFKSNSQTGSWETQSVDVSISSNNRWSLGDGGWGQKGTISNQQRYAPGTAIDGLVDIKNPHNQMFTNGTYSTTLEAHKTYEFKILETSTLYGLNDLIATSSISNQTLNTSGYQVRLCTAGAGTYTFAYNSSTHNLSITYPETSHPSIDYCYVIDYSWSPSANLHLWNGTSTKVAEWNGESTIVGSAWPGAAVSNKTTIGGQSYFYIAPGEFDYFMLSKNGDNNDRSGEIQPSDGYGKRRYWKDASDGWIWDTFTVRIQLENEDATSTGTEYQDIAFNSGVLSDITCPAKTHYDFQGYYTGDGGTGTQVIDEDGHWIASVADYTDASKHWIHAGTSTTLYAKWTEHEYALTINVSPAGAGTVSPSPSVVKLVTPTALLTATPSHGAWIFKGWQYSTNLGPYGETGTDNTVQVTASQDGTLTAVFEPRYTLVGSLTEAGDPAGGMPGWTDPNADAKAFAVVSTTPSLQMTKTCTLNPNSLYKFEVHDRKAGENYGYGDGTSIIDGNQSFNTQDRTVLLQTKGRGEYTFTISAITESGGKYYPTVSVSGPTSHFVTIKWADVDIDGSWNKTSRATGGTVAAVATESGKEAAISNGQYVAADGSIIYTATPVAGYTFGGWYNGGDWNTEFSNTNPITSSSISSAQDYEAKFVETPTAVTLANDGHGKVQINSTDQTSTTCGVTTTRQLNAVPNSGYSFSSWSKTGSDISLSATNTNPTTLTGGGSGASSQSVTAYFSANNYTITLDDNHGGSGGSASVTYDATSLTSISHASFEGWNLLGYWNMDGNKVIEANGDIVADVVNYTDASHKWNYANHVTLYAHWSRTITLDRKEGNSDGSVTVTYKGTAGTPSAPSRSGYTVEGYYAETGLTTKVMNPNGTLVADVSGYTNSSSEWIHGTAATLYTKWTANEYTITLNNLEATTAGTESVTATYDATLSAITKPTKTHYDFGGYWTSSNGGSTLTTQLIDENGNWKKSISGYTGASGDDPTWVYADNITLYAKWTEHEYTIALSVSPSGAGTTSPASSIVGKLVTESGDITATPAAGWKFKEWQFSKTDENNDVWCADGYSSTDATIHIKAQHNGTLTAVFEERYSLVGSLQDDSGEGGMPGWVDYTKTFTVNSSSPVDLTRTCTLQANKTYKVQVHDNATSTNLGRSGCDPVCVLEENASLLMENSNNDVFLYTSGAGEYIFKITAIDGSDHPTLTVLRPYPVNFGQKYEDIDGTLHAGTTGGTAAATAGGDALTSGDYVTYNTSVTHTATPASGYTFAGWWSSDAFEGDAFSNTNPMTYAVTFGDNTYAKFVETSTSVTLANDGHGKVQIGGVDRTSTTCGVTTTRELTAVPNAGYKFKNWTTSATPDFEVSNSTTATTTLTGHGAGTAGTLTANFEEGWVLSAQSEGWGSSTFTIGNISDVSGDAVGYVDISLPANTNLQFTMVDNATSTEYKNGINNVYYMTYTNHTDWGFGTDKTFNCGITTAGKGSYRFTWNITDKTITVTYPESYQVNYGASVGGSVTSVVDGDENAVPNGGYVVAGGSVTYTAAAASGYTFVGWCHDDSYGDTFTTNNPWTNSGVAATSSAYAKFKSTDFVIYRSGDMSSDPRAAYDDVESYAGGTISEAIEFRMRVNRLDKWYTLCLPFTVTAVKVWDEEDGQYYDIVPYYRSGGTFYTGHYIIRTPVSTTDFAIENFDSRDRWVDPSSADSYLPSKNTPYIIQWHDGYFSGKYISFFGPTGESIPTSMNQGANTSSDETVNIYGNNSMTSGTVRDAYMLDPDYGSGGAWLRAEVGTDRTVLPFECFIRANATTTAKYRVLRRDMADTPTGWDTVSETGNKTTKVLIDNNIYIIREGRIYTIQGTLVKEGK